MATYQYTAFDRQGREVRASSAADSPRQLRRELRDQGLFVTAVKEVSQSGSRRRWGRQRISHADLSLVMRQLAILVNSGMTLEEALRLVAEQSDDARQTQLLVSWRDGLAAGYGLAASMRRGPFRVPERVTAAVGVGEETGHLHKVLDRLAEELELGNDNRQALLKGMIYPVVMVAVAVAVISVLVGYVVPQVAKVFVNSRQELPLLTRATMGLSDFMRAWGLYLLALLAALVAAGVMALRDVDRRRRWHRLMLRMPLLGQWLLLGGLADWCRSLGTMLHSGVPVLSALSIAAAGVGNLHLRGKLEQVTDSVRHGNGLGSSLKAGDFAPGFLLHMVSSGEASSELDTMLVKVADYYTARLRNGVETLLKLMEPALILFMGLVVLLIVGAVLVPIVKMNQLI